MDILLLSSSQVVVNYILGLKQDPNYRLTVVGSSKYAPVLYYPGVESILLPAGTHHDGYWRRVEQLLFQTGATICLPTDDDTMKALMWRLRQTSGVRFLTYQPSQSAYAILSDKQALWTHVNRHFPGLMPDTCEETHAPPRFPVIVKPRAASGAADVFLVRDQALFERVCARLSRKYGEPPVVQAFVDGGNYVVTMLYDRRGSLARWITMRSRTTFYSWGGVGWSVTVEHEPALVEHADSVIQSAGGWQGPIHLEFRREARSGRFYLMEANPRLNGYSHLATHNGENFPLLTVYSLLGQALPTSSLSPVGERRGLIRGYREVAVSDWTCVPQMLREARLE